MCRSNVAAMEEPLAFLNGRFVSASSASISPVDAGFVLGAAIAEQLRTFGGRLFGLDDHLDRLQRSLRVVGVQPDLSRERFAEIAQQLAAGNHRLLEPGDDLGLAMIVTPGVYAAYAESGASAPTVCLHTYPLPFRLWADKYAGGQSLATTSVEQVPASCWPAELKCRSRMHYYLADREASRSDAGARALLLDHEGRVTETSTANVIVYHASRGLASPPRDRVLPGISLAMAAHLARDLGIGFVERDLSPGDIASADEVLLSSTPFCLLPVTRFDGRPIGGGSPGPVYDRLLSAWSDRVGIDIPAQARRFAVR